MFKNQRCSVGARPEHDRRGDGETRTGVGLVHLGRVAFALVLALGILGDSASAQTGCVPGADCNGNNVLDSCDITFGTSDDCDLNGVPDECDIAAAPNLDCNLDGILDSCVPVPDALLTSTFGFTGGAGDAVAIDGDVLVAGLPGDGTLGLNAGAALVFKRVGTRWVEEALLLASDGTGNDLFGFSVALEGGRIVVGAPGRHFGGLESVGAVYIFDRIGEAWTQTATLMQTVPLEGDRYGETLALQGDQLLTGAPQEPDLLVDPPGLTGGRATLHQYNGTSWDLVLNIQPGDLDDGDRFSAGLALDGDLIAIGAPAETAIGAPRSGTVRTYQRVNGVWLPTARIFAPLEQEDAFYGASIGLSNGRLAVGAPGASLDSGVVYTYVRVGFSWILEAFLSSPDAQPSGFGHALELSGTDLLIGEPLASAAGGAYLYERTLGSWILRRDIVPLGAGTGEQIGSAVSIGDKFLALGAHGLPGVYAIWSFDPIDCDLDGIEDQCAISSGLVSDCDLDGVPDSCQLLAGTASDCDNDGVLDSCALATGLATDCNLNGVLDNCELARGGLDCNQNGLPDDCDLDCNENGIPDDCDLVNGLVGDCNGNLLPDTCEISLGQVPDCNGNGTPDSCDLASDTSNDFNLNSIPDECDIASGAEPDCDGNGIIDSQDLATAAALDCNANGIPDSCDIASNLSDDCDLNGVPDECDFLTGAPDCNGNGVLDVCDIASGSSADCDLDEIPDDCQFAAGAPDCNGNGRLDHCDVALGVTVDNTPPVIAGMPASVTLVADPGTCSAPFSWAAPTITDNCELVDSAISHISGMLFPVGTTTVTATALDSYGNTSESSFDITVVDDQAPVSINVPADLTLTTGPGLCTATGVYAMPSTADNCGVASVVSSHPSGSAFPTGTTTVEITTTDVNGNSIVDAFTVTVTDDELPSILGMPGSLSASNDTGLCGAVVSWTAPTSTDNCGIASLVSTAEPGDTFPVGETQVSYTATDLSGNSTTSSFLVTVLDGEQPSISSLPADIQLTTDAGQCGAVAVWAEPLSADNCEIASFTADHTAGDFFPVGATTVTYTATDIHGNSAAAAFQVMVSDLQAPTITGLPESMVLTTDLDQCGAVASWLEPSASDNCGLASLTGTSSPGGFYPVGQTTVTYTASDIYGNSTADSFTITVHDAQLPTITNVPGNMTLTAQPGLCTAVATWGTPIVGDNCVISTFSATASPGDSFPVGTTAVQFSTSDLAGNSVSASFSITVLDEEAPTLASMPSNVILTSAPGECGALASWISPVALDNCSVATLEATAAVGDFFPVGTTTVEFTATDATGNSSSDSFTITVTDNEAPTITGLPTNVSLTNDAGVCGAVHAWTEPTIADNCGVDSISSTHASGDLFPLGTSQITYTVVDLHGNSSFASFTISVTDTEAPTFADMPADMTVSTDGVQCGASVMWTEPTITDNCLLDLQFSDSDPGDIFPLGTTTVSYLATDVYGNTYSTSFDITVVDASGPQIHGLEDLVVPAQPGACSAAVTWPAVTATDDCSLDTLVTDTTPGSTFPVGTSTVTYTATDIFGNVTTAGFTVTVLDDQGPAILGLPSDVVLSSSNSGCGSLVSWTSPTASDNCGVSSLTGSHTSGTYFAAGDTIVSYTATDIHGNSTTASFTITVTDLAAPTLLGVPSDITLSNDPGACGSVVSWASPTSTDNCGATVTSDHAPGELFAVGETVVTYTASDAQGNTDTASFTITIVDMEAPTLTGLADVTVPAGPGTCSATATWAAPTSDDNCSVASVTSSHAPGDSFPLGETLVSYVATDVSGNTTSVAFTVTVADLEAPMIANIPTDLSLPSEPGLCGATVTWMEPMVTDNCGASTLTGTGSPGQVYPVGESTVYYTAIDASGNVAEASFTITVLDSQGPEIVLFDPTAIVPNLNMCDVTISIPEPEATDACGGPVEIVNDFTGTSDASGSYPAGQTLITWTATDSEGNSTSVTQLIDTSTDAPDCNANGVLDACEILVTPGLDADQSGVLDQCESLFVRGDASRDGLVDIADIIQILSYLFLNGSDNNCSTAFDVTDDGQVEIADAINLASFLFQGGPPPAAPSLECGPDLTPTPGLVCYGSVCP
jgi:hypothetical protein